MFGFKQLLQHKEFHSGQPCHTQVMKAICRCIFRQYPAIHTNYIISHCTTLRSQLCIYCTQLKGLYRSWCGVNTLGNSGVNTLGDTSGFVNPTVQLLLTRRGKIRMDGVGIVFEFYIGLLYCIYSTL